MYPLLMNLDFEFDATEDVRENTYVDHNLNVTFHIIIVIRDSDMRLI